MNLKKIEGQEVEIKNLRKMLPERCKVILYDTLKKDKRARRAIFSGIDSLIVLYEGTVNGKRAGHYVILIPRPTHISYFSSLGKSPDHETTILGLENTTFKQLLGTNYKYSRVKLQRDAYNVNDCGLWCVARAYTHKIKIQDFQKLFLKRVSLQTTDDRMAFMTFLLQQNAV